MLLPSKRKRFIYISHFHSLPALTFATHLNGLIAANAYLHFNYSGTLKAVALGMNSTSKATKMVKECL